jgi:hypothetical protein
MLCLITVNGSFDYPEYPGNEGVGKYSVCDPDGAEFYTKNGYDREDPSIEQDFTLKNGTIVALTCFSALFSYDIIDQDENPYPPPDDFGSFFPFGSFFGGSDTNCCSAFRYDTDINIESKIAGVAAPVVLNIENEYGATESDEFVRLCEELWACSSYVEQYSVLQCEANPGNRGCEAYVDRSLCFNQAYDPTSTNEINQRKSFIVETCKFRLLWSVS